MRWEADSSGTLLDLRGLGWPVREREGAPVLLTTSGWSGVEVPRHLGDKVLAQLARFQAAGPVVTFPGPDPRYLFIAETDTIVDPDQVRRLEAVLWSAPAEIPLPPSRLRHGACGWVVPPDANTRRLPSLSTVIWSLDAALSPRGFSRPGTSPRRSVVAGGRIGTPYGGFPRQP